MFFTCSSKNVSPKLPNGERTATLPLHPNIPFGWSPPPTPSGVFFVCLGAPCACANVSPGPRSLSTHTHCKLRVSKITAGERERSGRSREYTERGWQWVEFFRAESEVYNVESRKRTNERSTARETRTRFVCNFVRVFFLFSYR